MSEPTTEEVYDKKVEEEEEKEEEIKEEKKEEKKIEEATEVEEEKEAEEEEAEETKKSKKKSKSKKSSHKTKDKEVVDEEKEEDDNNNDDGKEEKKSKKKKHKSEKEEDKKEDDKKINNVNKSDQVQQKYSNIESTQDMPYLWYREAGNCVGDAIYKESLDACALGKEGYLYVYQKNARHVNVKDSESGSDDDTSKERIKYGYKWGKVVKDTLTFVSPYDTVHLDNTYNAINKNESFNITADIDIHDIDPITINPARDVIFDQNGKNNVKDNDNNNGSSDTESDSDNDKDGKKLTLYGIMLYNDSDTKTVYMYTESEEEKAEWLNFLRKRVSTLKDPEYLAAKEDENMIVLDESGEWDVTSDDDDEGNGRTSTMGILHNIAIHGMATDKSKPMMESLNSQIQGKCSEDAVITTTFAISSENLAKSAALPEEKVAQCAEQDVVFAVPYILALTKFKIYVFLKESPCVFTYKALKQIASQSRWPTVITELKSRSDFWNWEIDYDGKDEDDSADDGGLRFLPSPTPQTTTEPPSPDKKRKKEKSKKDKKRKRKGDDENEGGDIDDNEGDDEERSENEGEAKESHLQKNDDDIGYVLDPLNIYLSECYLHNITPRQSFIDYARGAFAERNRELDLTACLDPAERGGKVDYNEILSFLHADKYFRGVSLSGVLPGDGLAAFSRVVASNSTLTRAVLRNVDIDEKRCVQLFDSLRGAEHFSRICSLDLTGSPLKGSGLKALVRWIGGLERGLVSLNLSNCEISTKGFQALFAAFKDNPTASRTIQSLVFTNNSKFGDAGSAALASWVSALPKGPMYLSTLGLGKCKAALGCLEPLGRLSLTHLDISDTQIPIKLGAGSSPAASAALSIFRSAKGPATLVIDRCVFADRPFFEAFSGSFITGGPERKIAAAEIQVKGVAPALVPLLLTQPSSAENSDCGLVKLSVPGVPLTPKSLNVFSSALALAETVRSLDISCPSKDVVAAEKMEGWVYEIAAIASGAKTLVELNISGGYGQNVIIDLLENHAEELSGIRSLDISGNGLGEKGMTAVLGFIKTNRTLNRLSVDNNEISLTMFTYIRNALVENNSSALFAMEFVNDYTLEAQRVASDKEKTRIIVGLQKEIKDRLRANYARVAASGEAIPPELAAYVPRSGYLDNSTFTPYDDNVRINPPVDTRK